MSEQKKETLTQNSENEQPEVMPAPWVRMASAYYQLDKGEHPALASDELFSLDPVLDELIEDHLFEYSLPIIPCIDGHNVMTTDGISSILDTNVKVPLSPNFVRDLAGRIIYIGYGPEQKKGSQWVNNRHVTFPKNCRVVTTDIEGSEYIENILLTRFRTLDTSTSYENPDHLSLFSYTGENLYPYKLRIDSFYQDGWRLPQTNLLYARKSVDAAKAKNIGMKFIEAWDTEKENCLYQEFLINNGGNEWLEKLFKSGCTIIPTTEAYNSYYTVGKNYQTGQRRNGRAVEGLHDVISTKSSSEPKGTILEVIQPGFITSQFIYAAQVIVSDGKRYEAEMKAFPLPSHPDIRLPHQRTQAVWGATWIPTHPSHFEEPAIWGWDMATGHFLQSTGPLWDPLHYYYESTPLIIKAFKDHSKAGKNIAYVPSEMKERFYPASAIKGFDMVSYSIKKMRHDKNIQPQSALLRVNDNKPSSDIGYHPLPLEFEYELGHRWLPELMPAGRTRSKPSHIALSPVITCNILPEDYHNNASDMNEYDRLNIPGVLRTPTYDPLQNYPQLHRYLSDYNPRLAQAYGRLILTLPESTFKSISELYLRPSIEDVIKATEMPFYTAVKEFNSASLNSINKTIEEYNSDLTSFLQKNWKCAP
tara:strand:- start:183468 stop:185405 length:1938 start_codon:yes stop_codon:yes gene_type:complete